MKYDFVRDECSVMLIYLGYAIKWNGEDMEQNQRDEEAQKV